MRDYRILSNRGTLCCVLVILLVLIVTLVPSYGENPKYGGTLSVGLVTAIDSIDIQKTTSYDAWNVLFAIYEPLVRYVAGEKVYEPFLAESWEWLDPQRLLFRLRKNVAFHDGSLFDAEDVKFTIERLQDPETAAPNARYVELIDEITILDLHTVEMHLSQPYAGILTNLDFVVMLNSEAPPAPNADLVGTGPFRFVEWIPGDHLTVERFADYWQEGIPYLDAIVFRPITDEQTRIVNLEADTVQFLVEISPEQITRIESNRDLQVIYGAPGNKLRVAMFITDVPPMDNKLVRRAVAHCIDRQGFVDSILYGLGTPTENIYSPLNPYYNPDTSQVYEYNIEKARALFQEAGYPEKFPDTASPISIIVPAGRTISENAAVLLQSALISAGVKCVIDKHDLATWGQVRETRNIVITLYSYGGVDPSVMLSTNFISPEKNLPHYYDGELTRLMDEAVGMGDFEARKRSYFAIQSILAYECPFSIIASLPQVTAARAYTKGIWMQPSWSIPIYHWTWLDK